MEDREKQSTKLMLTKADITLIKDLPYNDNQIKVLLSKTPKEFIKERPARGGGKWEYVSVGYIQKQLDLLFGFDWDFEILSETIGHGEVVVKGKLTARCNGKTIVKTQYGNKDIMYRKDGSTPLSIGNDMKAAASDCLKKCASLIGVARDIYAKDDFKEVQIIEIDWNDLRELFELKKTSISPTLAKRIEEIILTQNEALYSKVKSELLKA